MNSRLNILAVVACAALLAGSAYGQHRHYPIHQPGYHVDHHDHIVRDRHGHVVGRQHHDVIHQNPTYRTSPGYHIDHHDHVVRDRHGHVIGRQHHDVIHQNPTYVAPPVTQVYVPPTRHQTYRPVQPEFGSFSHVDELASRLETLATEFCLDLHYNYSHNPGYRETYREAYQILQVAKYIHAAEHQHDRAAIQQQLGGLDQTFHHVRDDVRGWSRHHHRQVGQLGILAKMDGIESSLHHLMNDVGVRPTPVQQVPAPSASVPPSLGAPPAPTPANGVIQSPATITTAPPATIQ